MVGFGRCVSADSDMTQKKCSSCNSTFGCDADTKGVACWCTRVSRVVELPEPGVDCLCPQCLEKKIASPSLESNASSPEPEANSDGPRVLVAGEDYYLEGGNLVFTRRYHLMRGYCCESGCRHCPYGSLPSQCRPANDSERTEYQPDVREPQ